RPHGAARRPMWGSSRQIPPIPIAGTGMKAPPPMVPAEVDLRDFPYMPFEVARLRRSKAWLICKRRPELAFYMLNLWTAAWHERPGGSLEDDDDVLADAAMCPVGALAAGKGGGDARLGEVLGLSPLSSSGRREGRRCLAQQDSEALAKRVRPY